MERVMETAPPCVRRSLPARSSCARSARAVTAEIPKRSQISETCSELRSFTSSTIIARRSSAEILSASFVLVFHMANLPCRDATAAPSAGSVHRLVLRWQHLCLIMTRARHGPGFA